MMLGKDIFPVIAGFSGDETPNGEEQQFTLFIPRDSILRQEKISKDGVQESL